MNLARHSLTPTTPTQFVDARFDADNKIFTTSTFKGYAVYSTWPLRLLKNRELSNGTLAIVQPLHTTSLLFFVGGGRSPLYPPNKVIFWDDAQGEEIAELEFRERVRGLACRRGWLVVALRRRVVAFKFDSENGRPERWKEWETCDNPRGLIALASAPYSTLLVIPGLQIGHVHLIHLPPCPPQPQLSQPSSQSSTARKQRPPPAHTHNPKEIIIAHESALTTLTVPPSGRILATTSSKGTLVRIWNSHTGILARELRRGTDRAEIFGVAFKGDESEICVWSDKGTIHVFRLGNVNEGGGNRQSALAPLSPFLKLHKYFESEWSYAHFRLPTPPPQLHLSNTTSVTAPKDELFEEERCVACWIEVPISDLDDSTVTSTGASRLKQPSSKAQSNQARLPTPQKVEHQLIVVTYSGGWYRLALPSSSRPRSRSISTVGGTSSSSTITGTTVTMGETARSASPSVRESQALRKAALTSASTSPKGKSPIQIYRPESVQGSVSGSATTMREHDYKGKARDTGEASSIASSPGPASKESGRRCTLVEFRKIGRWDGW